MFFTAAISWLVWIGLRGRKLAPQLAQTVQLDTTDTKYSSVLATLSVLTIPIVGIWELFRTDEPFGTHEIRLLIVMSAGAMLAVAVFIQDYLANREFTSDVGVAHDRLRLAMESSKSTGWDWDLIGGQNIWFGDLETTFGIASETYMAGDEEFYERMHPDDRDRVSKALTEAMQNQKPYMAEFRIVRPDGTVRWVTDRGKFYYAANGAAQRGLGIGVDVTDRKQAENALRESEERFRLVSNTAPVLIWMSGPDKLCTYFNKPWLDFTGRPLSDELGNGWVAGVHSEDLQKCLETYTQAFDRREEFRMEYRLRRRDGEYRWVLDIGVPRFNPDRSFAGYIGSCMDVTERKLAEEALSNVSSRLIEAQEQERTRIARDLHDDINQRLALLAIELERAKSDIPDSNGEALTRMDELRKHTSEIATDIQALSHELHSPRLEYLGIVAAMRGFCQEFGDKQKLDIDFRSHDLSNPVPADISLCLFRVLQEALHNAAKHSRAQRFAVQFWGTSGEIHLTISDAGVGFDVQAAMKGRGLGLISMQERIRLVNGNISIASKLKGGTEIKVRVPVHSSGVSNRINLSA
jgi:PAS domain S-box-containing protein